MPNKTRVRPNIKQLYHDILLRGCKVAEITPNFTEPDRIRNNPTAVIFIKIVDPKEPEFRYIQRYL